MKKSSSPASAVRPLRWLREASAEEIAESLLSIDPEKAVEVVSRLVARAGPEFGSRVDAAIASAKANPPRALLRAGAALLRGLSGS